MSNTKGNKWAVLIGVDFYIPGKARPGMKQVRNLRGCVADVKLVEECLGRSSDIEPHRIYKLTASIPNPCSDRQNEPEEPQSEWPTYENIIHVLQEVTRKAESNDLVYIHYSGHGARARTIFSHLKCSGGDLDADPTQITCDESKRRASDKAIMPDRDSTGRGRGRREDPEKYHALDEALVPTNIACEGGRYLRDVEIACLLWGMTERKLVVTVVFDSCHSGGGVRNEHVDLTMVRGIQEVDMNQLDSDKSVLPREMLAAAYERYVNLDDHGRTGEVPKHWLLESHGYAFLAACHADEFAKEQMFHGEVQGIFTHWLIDTLDSGSQLTYHKLYEIVSRKVSQSNPAQNLVLGGEGDRLFFDWGKSQPFYAATVIEEMNRSNGRPKLRLKAGQVHGISNGAVFDVWPKACSNFNDSTRLARLSVTKVEAFMLDFKLVASFRPEQIEAGCLALPFPQKRLKFVQSTDAASHDREEALRKAREACERHGHTVLGPDGPQNVKEDFRVLVKEGHYDVLDAEGEQLQHMIRPLRIDSDGSSEELGRRLTHIAKYYAIQAALKPKYSSSKEFSIEVGKMLEGLETRPRRWRSVMTVPARATVQLNQLDKGSNSIFEVADESFVLFRMENKADRPVHITVLNLEPSWAISQIYPGRKGTMYETLGPHTILDLPLKMKIPEAPNGEPEPSEIVDKFIVFATDIPTSFRWLELPRLDVVGHRHGDEPEDSDEMRTGFVYEEKESAPVQKWTTVEVVIRTKK